MWGGYTGPGHKTIIPAEAHAKLTFRLVSDQRPEDVGPQLRAWVEANLPAGIEAEVHTPPGGVSPCSSDLDSPWMAALLGAIAQAWDDEPGNVLYLREGGSGPEADLVEALGAPLLFLGAGLPTDRIHSPNERVLLSMLHRGAEAAAHLWRELARRRSDAADRQRRVPTTTVAPRSSSATRRASSPAAVTVVERGRRLALAGLEQQRAARGEPLRGGRDHPPGDVQTVRSAVERHPRLVQPGLRRHQRDRVAGHVRHVGEQQVDPPPHRRGQRVEQIALVGPATHLRDVPAGARDGGGVDVRGVQLDARHGRGHGDAQRPRPAAEVDDDGARAGQGDRLLHQDLGPAARDEDARR